MAAVTPVKINTGRRKEAVARVRLVPGAGEFDINGRSLEEYFPTRVHRMVAVSPLRVSGREKDYDVMRLEESEHELLLSQASRPLNVEALGHLNKLSH